MLSCCFPRSYWLHPAVSLRGSCVIFVFSRVVVLSKRCCCGAENSRDLFVLDFGRASDPDFFRSGRVCGFRVVRLGLSLADFFPSGSIRVCCFCRFNRGLLMVRFGVWIVLRPVPFFAEKTFWETFGACLRGALNCFPDFSLDAVFLLSPLSFPSAGLTFAFFRSMFLVTVKGGLRFTVPFPKVNRSGICLKRLITLLLIKGVLW